MNWNWFYIFKGCAMTVVLGVGVIKFIKKKKFTKIFINDDENDLLKCISVAKSPYSNWKKVGKIKELWLYPLKSGKGYPLKSCSFKISGMVADFPTNKAKLKDRFLVVFQQMKDNPSLRKFVTARQYPKLLLVEVIPMGEKCIILRVKGKMDDLVIDKSSIKFHQEIQVTMWFQEIVYCHMCDDEANKWISKYLTGKEDGGIGIGLSSPAKRRKVNLEAWRKHAEMYSNLRNNDMGLFSDLASYMLLSQSSIDHLNKKLLKETEVSQLPLPLQFRPNIVVEGCEPYAEDSWEYIKIRSNGPIIRQFKRVPRCTMVNIDPDTGERNPIGEPLAMLKKYRSIKDSKQSALELGAPCLGTYCGLIRSGFAKINDDIYVYKPANEFSSQLFTYVISGAKKMFNVMNFLFYRV